jgi:phosphoribosylformylglycinamidine (FGAM) synthase-like amidotransferase family enzyme
MPQPERASERALGNDDGKWIFDSVIAALEARRVAKAA